MEWSELNLKVVVSMLVATAKNINAIARAMCGSGALDKAFKQPEGEPQMQLFPEEISDREKLTISSLLHTLQSMTNVNELSEQLTKCQKDGERIGKEIEECVSPLVSAWEKLLQVLKNAGFDNNTEQPYSDAVEFVRNLVLNLALDEDRNLVARASTVRTAKQIGLCACNIDILPANFTFDKVATIEVGVSPTDKRLWINANGGCLVWIQNCNVALDDAGATSKE